MHRARNHFLVSTSVLTIVVCLGCQQAMELPSKQSVSSANSSKTGSWVIKPQPENSGETVRRYKLDENGITREVHIDFKNGDKAVLYLDIFNQQITSLWGKLYNGNVFSINFDHNQKISSWSEKDNTGNLVYKINAIADGKQRMTWYDKSGGKLAEVSGKIILGNQRQEQTFQVDNLEEFKKVNNRAVYPVNEWVFFHPDGITPHIKVEVTRYCFTDGIINQSGKSCWWWMHNKDLAGNKQVYSPVGELIYEEKFTGITSRKWSDQPIGKYECFRYTNGIALSRAIITKSPFDEHIPKIGTMTQFDELNADGSIKHTQEFNILTGWLCEEGKVIPNQSLRHLLMESEKCFEQIDAYQTRYDIACQFVRPLITP